MAASLLGLSWWQGKGRRSRMGALFKPVAATAAGRLQLAAGWLQSSDLDGCSHPTTRLTAGSWMLGSWELEAGAQLEAVCPCSRVGCPGSSRVGCPWEQGSPLCAPAPLSLLACKSSGLSAQLY